MKILCNNRKDISKRSNLERYKNKTRTTSSNNAAFYQLNPMILPPKMCFLIVMRRKNIKLMNTESVTTLFRT